MAFPCMLIGELVRSISEPFTGTLIQFSWFCFWLNRFPRHQLLTVLVEVNILSYNGVCVWGGVTLEKIGMKNILRHKNKINIKGNSALCEKKNLSWMIRMLRIIQKHSVKWVRNWQSRIHPVLPPWIDLCMNWCAKAPIVFKNRVAYLGGLQVTSKGKFGKPVFIYSLRFICRMVV